MKPEEFIEKLRDGSLKPVISQGRLIAMENEQGRKIPIEYIDEPVEEKLPGRIKIKKPEIIFDRASKSIIFSLPLENTINYKFDITSFNCRIRCGPIPLQMVKWVNGDKFTSNGFEPGIPSLPGIGSTSVRFHFNSYACPRIPKKEDWYIEGNITLFSSSLERQFSIEFNEPVKIKEEYWRELETIGLKAVEETEI